MAKRNRFFKTAKEARTYLKGYEPKYVTDPHPTDMRVFKLRGRFFLGTPFEFDFERFS